MPKKTKHKTICYRRCNAESPGGKKAPVEFYLQALLARAAQINARPWMRVIGLDPEGSQREFLAHLVNKEGCITGALVLCDEREIPLIDAEKDGSTWEGTMSPRDTKGKNRKIEEQALFFAIRENHVAVIQTKELSISEFQDFLFWFIQKQAKLVEGWQFVLQNLPSKDALKKLKGHQIKEISIGKNAFSIVKVPAVARDDGRRRFNRVIKTDPFILDLLKKLTKNDVLLDDLDEGSDPGSIYVELNIRYKSRSQKDAQEVMHALAATLGDQADLSPEIRLDDKSKIKGDELTILGYADVQSPGGNISKDDAMTKITEWLLDAIKGGKVVT